MPLAGDIVEYDARTLVVVDVTETGIAVLRREDDLDLLEPFAVLADAVKVVGHLERLDGWVEDSPGIWSSV